MIAVARVDRRGDRVRGEAVVVGSGTCSADLLDRRHRTRTEEGESRVAGGDIAFLVVVALIVAASPG
jgi:hypothetical protein